MSCDFSHAHVSIDIMFVSWNHPFLLQSIKPPVMKLTCYAKETHDKPDVVPTLVRLQFYRQLETIQL
jgi:hypothetical protein